MSSVCLSRAGCLLGLGFVIMLIAVMKKSLSKIFVHHYHNSPKNDLCEFHEQYFFCSRISSCMIFDLRAPTFFWTFTSYFQNSRLQSAGGWDTLFRFMDQVCFVGVQLVIRSI